MVEPITTVAGLAAATAAARNIVDTYQKIAEGKADAIANVSLTSYAKSSILTSRAYIDGSLVNEPVTKDILGVCHTLYTAFILNALNMNKLVTGGKSVKDMLQVVSTEAFEDHQNVGSAFESFGAMESDVSDTEQYTKDSNGNYVLKKDVESIKSAEIKRVDSDVHLPVGKIIEVTLTNPETDSSAKISLLVQIVPYVVPESVVERMINYSYVPTLMQRLIQWRTGEISGWRDLIWQLDLVEKRRRARNEDTSGVLRELYGQQTAAQKKVVANYKRDKADRMRNIANSVLIFNEQNLRQAKAESGIDLTDAGTRNRYFQSTFAMMIVVVDTMYNHVTIYLNGIDSHGTYNFDQMKASSKKTEFDLAGFMSALAQGKAPRF